MNYSDFCTEDFITDENFIRWVNKPDEKNNLFWENWLLENPAKRQEVEAAKAFILSLSFEKNNLSKLEVENLLQDIHNKIDTPNLSNKTKRLPLRWIGIAAIFFLVLAGSWWAFSNSNEVYTTAFNETKTMQLPDGSEVILNANSELTTSSNWKNESTREVWLKGEAFFQVSEKPIKGARKFIVHTKDLDVEVLGTVFNVNARNIKTTVVLKSGKIQLIAANVINESPKKLTVSPAEKVTFQEKELKKETVNTDVYTSWIAKKIVLENTPLFHVVEILENNYGFQVDIENRELLNKKLTGTAPLNQDPNILLKSLEAMLDLTIEKTGKKIIIR